MKKLFASKPFIVTTMLVLCVAILAVCLLINQDRVAEFEPELPQQSESSESVSDWQENGNNTVDTKHSETIQPTQEQQEVYPKVVEDDGENVVIEFTPTPPQSSETDAPEVPEGKTEIEKPKQNLEVSHPVTPDPNVKPAEPQPQKPSGPEPGSTNSQGQVYDAVFGWVTPSKIQTIPSDNDGDPNKMVGSMD